MNCENDSCRFVAEDVIFPDDHCWSNTAMVPEMDVRATDSCRFYGNVDFSGGEVCAGRDIFEGRGGRGNPEIVVRVGEDSDVGFGSFCAGKLYV